MRNFGADAPGIKVFTDITQMLCSDGKLYFCGVLDASVGAEIGYSLANHMRTELCTAALLEAERRYGLAKDCIVHSDHAANLPRIYTAKSLRTMAFGNPWEAPVAVVITLEPKAFLLPLKKNSSTSCHSPA